MGNSWKWQGALLAIVLPALPALGQEEKLTVVWKKTTPAVRFIPNINAKKLGKNERLYLMVFLSPEKGENLNDLLDNDIGVIGGRESVGWSGMTKAAIFFTSISKKDGFQGYRFLVFDEGKTLIKNGRAIEVPLTAPKGGVVDWKWVGKTGKVQVSIGVFQIGALPIGKVKGPAGNIRDPAGRAAVRRALAKYTITDFMLPFERLEFETKAKEQANSGNKEEDAKGADDPLVKAALELEKAAFAKLQLAKMLANAGRVAKAKARYKDIISQYPETKAAKEARALLAKLKK